MMVTVRGKPGIREELFASLVDKANARAHKDRWEHWIDDVCLEVAREYRGEYSRRGTYIEFDLRFRINWD